MDGAAELPPSVPGCELESVPKFRFARRKGMKRQPYPSDLTDAQWAILEPLTPPEKPLGRPRGVDLREVINAVLYRNRNGCTWRALPHDFPPWRNVYNYCRAWALDGTWQRINDTLRCRVRKRAISGCLGDRRPALAADRAHPPGGRPAP